MWFCEALIVSCHVQLWPPVEGKGTKTYQVQTYRITTAKDIQQLVSLAVTDSTINEPLAYLRESSGGRIASGQRHNPLFTQL
jgi:hypothetical protein